MWFIIIAVVLWMCYVAMLIMIDKSNFRLSKAMIPLILINIILSIGIGVDWFRYELKLDHAFTIILTKYIMLIKPSVYSTAFNISIYVSLALVVLYMVLTVLEKKRAVERGRQH